MPNRGGVGPYLENSKYLFIFIFDPFPKSKKINFYKIFFFPFIQFKKWPFAVNTHNSLKHETIITNMIILQTNVVVWKYPIKVINISTFHVNKRVMNVNIYIVSFIHIPNTQTFSHKNTTVENKK